jgi:nucleotide-binding universal stress UspA family protein
MSTVLLVATDHDRWTRAVAETAATLEEEGTDAVVLRPLADRDVAAAASDLDTGRARARDVPDSPEADLDALARRKSGVEDAVDRLETRAIDTRVRGVAVDDDRGERVLGTADEVDADRIYVYSRRRSPAGKAVFGSAVQHVLRHSDVPVVVTPAAAV